MEYAFASLVSREDDLVKFEDHFMAPCEDSNIWECFYIPDKGLEACFFALLVRL